MVVDSSNAGLTFSTQVSATTYNVYGATGSTTIYMDGSDNLYVGQGHSGTYFVDDIDDAISIITPRDVGPSAAGMAEINTTGVYGYIFPDGQTKNLSFMCQLPHTWNAGTNVVPHIHYCGSSANTSNIVFTLKYWCASLNQAIPSGAGVTTISSNIIPPGVAYQHKIAGWGSIAVTGNTESCIFGGYVERNGATDEYVGDVYVLSIDLHIRKHKWGRWLGYPQYG